jgi:hypothetical protein
MEPLTRDDIERARGQIIILERKLRVIEQASGREEPLERAGVAFMSRFVETVARMLQAPVLTQMPATCPRCLERWSPRPQDPPRRDVGLDKQHLCSSCYVRLADPKLLPRLAVFFLALAEVIAARCTDDRQVMVTALVLYAQRTFRPLFANDIVATWTRLSDAFYRLANEAEWSSVAGTWPGPPPCATCGDFGFLKSDPKTLDLTRPCPEEGCSAGRRAREYQP